MRDDYGFRPGDKVLVLVPAREVGLSRAAPTEDSAAGQAAAYQYWKLIVAAQPQERHQKTA